MQVIFEKSRFGLVSSKVTVIAFSSDVEAEQYFYVWFSLLFVAGLYWLAQEVWKLRTALKTNTGDKGPVHHARAWFKCLPAVSTYIRDLWNYVDVMIILFLLMRGADVLANEILLFGAGFSDVGQNMLGSGADWFLQWDAFDKNNANSGRLHLTTLPPYRT